MRAVNMNAFTYRCPNTGKNVQGWSSDAGSSDSQASIYISTQCPACSRIHLIDPATGAVLGGDEHHAWQTAELHGWLAP
jgi:hypothetical protein